MFSLSSCLFYPARLLLPSGVFFDPNYCNWQGVDIQLQRVDLVGLHNS
jgi:hypothetical protein